MTFAIFSLAEPLVDILRVGTLELDMLMTDFQH